MGHVRDNKFYYVYVLRSLKDVKWYIGYTSNLRERFVEHGKNIRGWTKGKGPFEIIYYEASIDDEDARSRELYIKTGMGRRYLNNRLKRFLSLT